MSAGARVHVVRPRPRRADGDGRRGPSQRRRRRRAEQAAVPRHRTRRPYVRAGPAEGEAGARLLHDRDQRRSAEAGLVATRSLRSRGESPDAQPHRPSQTRRCSESPEPR